MMPESKFEVGTYLKAPEKVASTKKVYVASKEYVTDGSRWTRLRGWVYKLTEVPAGGFPLSSMLGIAWPLGGTQFYTTEAELEGWQK